MTKTFLHARIITVLLILALLLSACTGTTSPSPTAGVTVNPTAESANTPANVDPENTEAERTLENNVYSTGLPIVEEKETVRIAWGRSSTSPIAPSDKAASIMGEKDTNVAISWVEIDSAGWNEKVGIMLASQDLPDAFMGNLNSVMNSNLEAFVDLTSYINDYAPNLSAAMEEYPLIKPLLTRGDGSIRTLPTSQMLKPDESTSALYWINSQWLTAVGKDLPTNLDELHDVLVAFRDGDPNGNGQKDEIPFSFCNSYWAGGLSSMFGPFGVLNTPNHVLVNDGNVVFQPTEQGFYDALVYFNQLYSEGLFDSEGFSQTSSQHSTKISQEILGIFAVYDPKGQAGADHPYVPLPPILGANGTTLYDGSNDLNVIQNFGITIACEKPEILVRYHDYVNDSMENKLTWNYGPEGDLWTLNNDGTWNQLEDNLSEGEVWDQRRGDVGFSTSCFAFFTPAECQLILDRSVQSRLDAVEKLSQYYPAEPYHYVADAADVVSEKNLLRTEIDAYIASFVATSIMDGIDQTKWDAHVAYCKTLGVERYLELMQVPYDGFNALLAQ